MTPIVFVDPCSNATPACRAAAQDAIIIWRTRSATMADALVACRTKLDARTKPALREVSKEIAREAPPPAETGPGWGWVAGAAGFGVVVGAVLMLVAR